ncbi:MAG: T9SS type A sorting domain-containing protein [Bacteroidales bacterium]|jgi:aminopeptidase N|nr:T9SS type A sorting domain-containing protein [Bacteroidales bacterium]
MKKSHFFLLANLIMMLVVSAAYGQNITHYMGKDRIIKKNTSPKVLPTEIQKAYDVKWYFLNLNAESGTVELSGDVTVKAEVVEPVMNVFSFHLHRDYLIDKILVNGEEKEFETKEDERLVAGLDLKQGDVFEIQIFYNGSFIESDDHFFSGISAAYDDRYGFNVTWTLSQANNAYHWFPVKQDLTDKIDSVWIFVTTTKPNKVGANGTLTKVADLPDNKARYEWKSNYMIDYYLISIAIADYQEYSIYATIPQTGEDVLIQNYIYNSPECLNMHKDAINKTKDMIEYFSELFGPYPFANEKYGHTMAYLGGAMEHQTMTTTGYLYDGIIVHELIHQWFGDLVTCASWEYIWLNEGFASYGELIWNEHVNGKESAFKEFANQVIKEVRDKGKTGSVYVPEAYIDDESRIFNNVLTYRKGAVLVHMLRYELDNDDLFYEILQTYLQRYSHGVATVDDFKSVLEELSGKDFTVFFDQWYYGEGYPVFKMYWSLNGNTLTFDSEQNCTAANVTPVFKFTFEIELQYENGDKEIIAFYQDQKQQQFTHTIPEGAIITNIKFDPNYWLLASGTFYYKSDAINDQDMSDKILVYPNPATSFINIQFDNILSGGKKIDIFDATGTLIHTFHTNKEYYQLDISNFASGIYFLTLYHEGKKHIQKIIK